MSDKAIVKRVDHVVFRTGNPHELFSILAGTLQLPVAWPVTDYEFFTSGGVFAGNSYLEAMRFRNGSVEKERVAHLWGLAFEPYSLSESLDELASRDIPHSPPFSYYGERIDGTKGKAWTNVTLGELLSDKYRPFLVGRRLGGNTRLNLAAGRLSSILIQSSLGGLLIGKFLDDSMIYLCEYTHDNDRLMGSKREELLAGQGGPLGVEGVEEIVLSVTDYEGKHAAWQNLMAPTASSARGCWRPGGGASVRLALGAKNEFARLVLKVRSLRDARRFLSDEGLLGVDRGDEIAIDPARVQGLSIHLSE
jgi:hypothetical protein